jgi:predicted alpha-1,6-mannanase (GH76 family)
MTASPSTVISMRLPAESGKRLKRLASRHGWTTSDLSARLVEEGLRRAEFAFIDFRDSAAGRQAYIQGSSLAVWEVIALVKSYKGDSEAVAKHLRWPVVKVAAAVHYSEAHADEIGDALAENESIDLATINRMLPQTTVFKTGQGSRKGTKG